MGMEETVDKLAPLSERQKEDFIAVATRTESERLMKVGEESGSIALTVCAGPWCGASYWQDEPRGGQAQGRVEVKISATASGSVGQAAENPGEQSIGV